MLLKEAKSLYPEFEGNDVDLSIITMPSNTPGTSVDLSLGIDRTVQSFNTTDDYKIDPRITGRLVNIRFTDNGTNDRLWRLSGYSIDADMDGTR